MVKTVEWAKLRRDQVGELAQSGAWVLVPIGSIEQHGEHLPLDTDTMSAWHVALNAARQLDNPTAIVTPPVWTGLSPHRLRYPGVISPRLETLMALWSDICIGIADQGFPGIVMVNGHGGNTPLLGAITLELQHRHHLPVYSVTYWDLITDVMDEVREGTGPNIGHAGELETSIQLFLQPEYVRDYKPLVDGITDDPNLAQVDKGQRLMDAAIQALVDYVHKVAKQ